MTTNQKTVTLEPSIEQRVSALYEATAYQQLIDEGVAYRRDDGTFVITDEYLAPRGLINDFVRDVHSSTALAWGHCEVLSNGKVVLKRLYLARYSEYLMAFVERVYCDHNTPGFTPSICSTILYE